jgi:hypothetical protein
VEFFGIYPQRKSTRAASSHPRKNAARSFRLLRQPQFLPPISFIVNNRAATARERISGPTGEPPVKPDRKLSALAVLAPVQGFTAIFFHNFAGNIARTEPTKSVFNQPPVTATA